MGIIKENRNNAHCSPKNSLLQLKFLFHITSWKESFADPELETHVFYLLRWHSKAYGQLIIAWAPKGYGSITVHHSKLQAWEQSERLGIFFTRQNGLFLDLERGKKQNERKMLLSVLSEKHCLYLRVAHF